MGFCQAHACGFIHIRVGRNAGLVCAAADSPSTDLSARERRRQKNERRLEVAESRRGAQEQNEENWEKGVVQKLTTRKKKSEHNMTELEKLGLTWYALRVLSGKEAQCVETLQEALTASFPQAQLEIWCPVIPREITSKGKTRLALKSVLPGHVFIRCVMNRALHRYIVSERSVFNFVAAKYKRKEGYNTKLLYGGYPDVWLPTPVSEFNIEQLREEARKQEEEFMLKVKTREEQQLRAEIEEERKRAVIETELKREVALQEDLLAGNEVEIVAGPYQKLRGRVVELLPAGRVKVIVTVLGADADIEVNVQDLELNT